MSLKALSNIVTSKVGRQILITQKHSPVLMVSTGVIGVVAAGVLACRATLKMDEILREAEHDREKIAEAEALKSEKYTEDDKNRDLKLSRVKLAIEVVKAYGPAVALGVVSITLIAGSHVILSRRNAGLTAAYAAIEKAYEGYRSRVLADVGEEKEKEYRYDLIDKEIAVEDADGVHTETIKVPGPGGFSDYARCFDESNVNWQRDNMYNSMFLTSQQTWLNNKLRADGHVFLNDVYRALGFKDSSAGAVTGWIDNGQGDNQIIFLTNSDRGNEFIRGNEESVWIDFNVDGPIYKLLDDR